MPWMAKSHFGCVSFFAYMDVGKGREQDAEAFVKRNELDVVETAFKSLDFKPLRSLTSMSPLHTVLPVHKK
jgi:hypothetical protein